MSISDVLILISGLSFLGYGIHYFLSSQMKEEFKRFGLEKLGTTTGVLQLLGGTGLLIGLKVYPLLLFSSAGLSLMMLFAVLVRIKMKDSLWVTIPSLFFLLLNVSIFYTAYTQPLEIIN